MEIVAVSIVRTSTGTLQRSDDEEYSVAGLTQITGADTYFYPQGNGVQEVAAAGGLLPAYSQGPRMAVAGDSIAQALGTYSATNSYNTLNSIPGWANMLNGGGLYFPQGGNVAVGGRSIATIASNFIAEIGPIGANVIFCNGGINDLNSMTDVQILAQWDTIIAARATLPEDPYLIILPITPSSTQLAYDAKRLSVNAGLAARATNKVRILDISGFDYSTMCYAQVLPATGERIHPNVLGCQFLAPRLQAIFNAIAGTFDPTLASADANNKIGARGGMAGTSGSKAGTPAATGNVADNWTLDAGDSGVTVVGSKSTLAGGEAAQQIVLSGAYTGSSKTVTLASGSIPVSGLAAGDLIEVTAKIEASGLSKVDGFGLFAFIQDSGFSLRAQCSEMVTNVANDSGHTNPGNYSITLRAMPFGAPSNTPAYVSLNFSAYLQEGGSASAVAGAIKIGKVAVRKITAEKPGRMAAPVLTPGNGSISVDRANDPPNNGAPITSYELRHSPDGASWTVVSMTTDPQVVSGLTNGTAYVAQTRANNAAGNGEWSPSSAPAIPAAPVTTTLNPTEANPNNVLSNGNRTVGGAGNPGQHIRTVKGYATGKFEVDFIVNAIGSGMGLGLSDTAGAIASTGFNGMAGSDKALGIDPTGNVYAGTSFNVLGNIGGAYTTGDKVRMCVDIGARRVWFRKNNAGNWNNSGTANPATGVGGFNINLGAGNGTLSGTLHAAIGHQGGNASVTLDPDPASRQSGFGAWLA